MKTKFIATVKVNVKGMHPNDVPQFIETIKQTAMDEEFYEFFGGRNNVYVVFIPVKEEDSNFKVERIEVGNSAVEELLGVDPFDGPKHTFIPEVSKVPEKKSEPIKVSIAQSINTQNWVIKNNSMYSLLGAN